MACDKRSYSSFREAQEVLNRSKKHHRDGKKDKKLRRSYLCDPCGMFHLTSRFNDSQFYGK